MTKHRGFIFWLCFIIAALVLTGCGSRAVTPVPNTPTKAETETSVPTASPTAPVTRIARPTSTVNATPTMEPTWTPFPTSTPIVPTQMSGQGYRLTNWTEEKAEQLIHYLKNYPETLSMQDRGYMDSGYHSAFHAEGIAELESSLRFPKSDHKESWQWDGAYNLYQSSITDPGSLYAARIADAFNQKETNLENFERWAAKTIPFTLNIYPVTPPKNFQNSFILHFYKGRNNEASTGFAVWLIQKSGIFYGYSLPNIFEMAFGDASNSIEVADITGDGIAEAIVQNADWQSFGMHAGNLKIYRLDQVPPQEMTFDRPLFDPEIAVWTIDQSQSVPTITFQTRISTISDMPCNEHEVGWQYQWQDGQLKFIKIIAPPLESLEERPYCARNLAYILRANQYLDNSSALQLYKDLLELPFLEKDVFSNEYGFDFLEHERLSLAIFLKRQGDEAGANEQISLIRSSDEPEQGEWRENALAYYEVHDDPKALYQYCLISKTCESFLSLSKIISIVPLEQFIESETVLREMGVDFKDSGDYDFDGDGTMEKWLFFLSDYPCGSGTQLLILAQVSEKIKSRTIWDLCIREEGTIKGNAEIKSIEAPGDLPAYQLTVDGVESLLAPFLYWPLDQEDQTINVQDARRMIDTIQTKLLLEQISPLEAQNQILAIQQAPINQYFWEREGPVRMLYLLGLTQELIGQSQQAVQTYLELWENYPDSPYAYMAWVKLEPEN